MDILDLDYFGIFNKKKIGLMNRDELLLVKEVKSVAGNFIWIKCRKILKKASMNSFH